MNPAQFWACKKNMSSNEMHLHTNQLTKMSEQNHFDVTSNIVGPKINGKTSCFRFEAMHLIEIWFHLLLISWSVKGRIVVATTNPVATFSHALSLEQYSNVHDSKRTGHKCAQSLDGKCQWSYTAKTNYSIGCPLRTTHQRCGSNKNNGKNPSFRCLEKIAGNTRTLLIGIARSTLPWSNFIRNQQIIRCKFWARANDVFVAYSKLVCARSRLSYLPSSFAYTVKVLPVDSNNAKKPI